MIVEIMKYSIAICRAGLKSLVVTEKEKSSFRTKIKFKHPASIAGTQGFLMRDVTFDQTINPRGHS